MLLKSNCLFFSVKQAKPLLPLIVQPLSNTNKSGFALKLHIKTYTALTRNRGDITLKAKTNSFHTGFITRKDPIWIFTRTNLEACTDEVSPIFNSEFQKSEKKDKKAFLETVKIYTTNVKSKTSHVDFMRTAMMHMKAFGVERDLECYKKLLDIFPKGVFICTNILLSEGMYYPRQQFATLALLLQMESYGVIPDVEVGDILKRTFGKKSHPYQKYARMLYWSLKLKNKSPWLLPEKLPSDHLALAKLAIERITSVDIQTEISVYQTDELEESIDKTWIVSGQSPKQKKLLSEHTNKSPVVVEGGEVVWLKDKSIGYFVLKTDGEPLPYIPPRDNNDISRLQSKFFNPNYKAKDDEFPSVHVQDDGIIYAVCATGTSSKDSLLSWVRILEKNGNSILSDVPVLFRFKQPQKIPTPFSKAVIPSE